MLYALRLTRRASRRGIPALRKDLIFLTERAAKGEDGLSSWRSGEVTVEATVEGEEGLLKRSAGVLKLPEERTERDRAALTVAMATSVPLRGAPLRRYSSSSLALAELSSCSDSLSRCAHAFTRGRAAALAMPIIVRVDYGVA